LTGPPAAPAVASSSARAWLREWLARGPLPPVPSGTSLAALVAAAREQRLVGLLHASVSAQGGAEWTAALRESLAGEQRSLLVRTVQQLDLLARVDALLAARGLRVLPLKGAALVESLYASPAERPMADVDALALDDWGSSVRTLEEAGFTCAERADHAWSFVDPETGTLLELHHSVTSCPGLFRLDPGALWAGQRKGAGQVARIPSAEDLLVQLAQHALFQHAGVLSLVQWLDFRRILERDPPDRERLAQIARHDGATACLTAALCAAEAVVGAPHAAGLGEEPLLPRGLRRWLDDVRRDPFLAVLPTPPALVRVRWAVAAGRRWVLVRGTLRPAGGEHQGTGLRAGAALVRRAAGLVRRWGTTILR
jgi:hypothetical protein